MGNWPGELQLRGEPKGRDLSGGCGSQQKGDADMDEGVRQGREEQSQAGCRGHAEQQNRPERRWAREGNRAGECRVLEPKEEGGLATLCTWEVTGCQKRELQPLTLVRAKAGRQQAEQGRALGQAYGAHS